MEIRKATSFIAWCDEPMEIPSETDIYEEHMFELAFQLKHGTEILPKEVRDTCDEILGRNKEKYKERLKSLDVSKFQ